MTYNEETLKMLSGSDQYVIAMLVHGKIVVRFASEDGLTALGLANKLNFEINAECKKEIDHDLSDFYAG